MQKHPFHVVLWEPEIPPNAGNVARLCAATDTILHFVGRLGFRLDDKTIRRAGLDYWPFVQYQRHDTWDEFETYFEKYSAECRESEILVEGANVHKPMPMPKPTLWLIDNPAEKSYTQARFHAGDALVFGSESAGLPKTVKNRYIGQTLQIPMKNPNVRSLNLATSVGIILYEAIRQQQDC